MEKSSVETKALFENSGLQPDKRVQKSGLQFINNLLGQVTQATPMYQQITKWE